jgi:phosphate transport system permease protein
LWVGVAIFAVVIVLILEGLISQSTTVFHHFGIQFLWSKTWSLQKNQFGAAPFIVGTLYTTAIALVIAIPVGIATASYLTEMSPKTISAPLATLIDLIAAVPSIVVGLWAFYVLAPVYLRDVEPFLKKVPVIEWFVHGYPEGTGLLLAGTVLAVMIVPTVVALTRTALAGVGTADREAALALGATSWQVVRRVVIPGARSGITAAITLALGRSVGETIAVAIVIGNGYYIPHSLLSSSATLGSVIVNQFGESNPGTLLRSSLLTLGLLLLIITLLVNIGGQIMIRRGINQGNPR